MAGKQIPVFGRRATEMHAIASRYRARGLSIVPRHKHVDRPRIPNWSIYSKRLPTERELATWFGVWPDSGIACVLPLSGLVALNVYGLESDQETSYLLGKRSRTPKIERPGKPHHYCLLFRHEGPVSVASSWDGTLRVKLQTTYVSLPPSLDRAGKPLCWAPGQSLEDVEPADLPKRFLAMIEPVSTEPQALDPPAPTVSQADLKRAEVAIAYLTDLRSRLDHARCEIAPGKLTVIRASKYPDGLGVYRAQPGIPIDLSCGLRWF